MLVLPQRKHVKVISKTALLEFKVGSAERGRGIFEGLLRNYPKRIDLWSVYLDQEVKAGDKMKFLFKRFLEYEKTHGDAAGVAHVKRRAMEFVEASITV
ncbi:MAG: hypothetical protein WDW38_001820 [Sanguina aurantia]